MTTQLLGLTIIIGVSLFMSTVEPQKDKFNRPTTKTIQIAITLIILILFGAFLLITP